MSADTVYEVMTWDTIINIFIDFLISQPKHRTS